MIKKLRLSQLDLDFSLYPREHVNPYHVEQILEALRAGAKVPPITVDKATYKVTDGWHRVEAFRKLDGGKARIECDLKEYASQADMFADAIRLNASHGQTLSKMDQARCLSKAKELNMEQAVVASLLNITVERAGELVTSRLATSGGAEVVLKGSTAWMAGRRMTEDQVNYNRKAGGMHQTFYINQVIAMLENEAVDWDNESVSNGLKKLYELLESTLHVKV